MRRWWREESTPHRLGAWCVFSCAAALYFSFVEVSPFFAVITPLTIWDAGCVMESTSPAYGNWKPERRLPRVVKSYVDVVHSVRYGRGQRVLRAVVVILAVVLAAVLFAWTAF